MSVFKIIFLLLAVFSPAAILSYILVFAKKRYSENKDKWNFFNPLRHKTIFSIIILSSLALIIVNLFFKEPSFENPQKKINYGKKRMLPNMVKDGYYDLISDSFYVPDYHIKYIKWHFKQPKSKKTGNIIHQRNDNDVFQFYNFLKYNNNDSLSNIGKIGYAYCLFSAGHYSDAIYYLRKNIPEEIRFKNFIIGFSYHRLNSYLLAEKYYLNEAQLQSGYYQGAIENLVKLYLKDKKSEKALPLVANKKFRTYIEYKDLKNISILNNKVFDFIKYYSLLIYYNSDIIGFIAALLICATWLYYLRRIDIFEKEKWYLLFIVLLLGAMFSTGANYFAVLTKYQFDLKLNGNFFNDLFYMTFNVGLIEEIFKILPLILLILFTKSLNEPYDYILFASVSALGFAFIENLIYFKTDALHIVHGRALISVVGHMFNSSVIAYGLILAKYKKMFNPIIAFFLFLILASLIHGFFNLILIYNFQFIFLVYFLFCIRIWVIFINNALNNSAFFDYKIRMRSGEVQFYLVTALTSILVFEYVTIGWIYGPNTANINLLDSSSMGSIIILFLATRLSKFDLVKKHWSIIDYRINPFHFKNYPLNFVGYKIQIESYYQSSMLGEIIPYPINGVISDRIKITNDNIWKFKKRKHEYNWFKVKLDSAIQVKNLKYKYILLKFRSRQPKLKKEKDLLAKMLIRKRTTCLNANQLNREDLKFMGGVIVNLISQD